MRFTVISLERRVNGKGEGNSSFELLPFLGHRYTSRHRRRRRRQRRQLTAEHHPNELPLLCVRL